MKTKDVIKQLIENEPSGADPIDTLAINLYDAQVKGVKYSTVTVDFEKGIVHCYGESDDYEKVGPKFAIKATLEEITES